MSRLPAGVSAVLAKAAGDDAAVDDQVVHIAPVHEALGIALRLGRGQVDDVEPAPPRICRLGQQRPDVAHHGVVGMAGVGLVVQQDRSGGRECRDDIDMPAGAEGFIVAFQPARKPDRPGRTKRARHFRLYPCLVGMGIAARVKLHRFGQKDGAFAVDMKAAALIDEKRGHDRHACEPRDELRQPAVVRGTCPFCRAPAVEDPVHRGERPVCRDHEGRPGIAQPEFVDHAPDDLDPGVEHAARAGDFGGIDDHRHRFESGDRVGDGGPGGVACLPFGEGFAKGQALARERHPDAVLRRCFGRHRPGHVSSSVWRSFPSPV